jgi:hypothetical protein
MLARGIAARVSETARCFACRAVVVAILAVVAILLPATPVIARRGCCSWHGGVCGCQCCDNSALSAKCAPYYPKCQGTPKSSKSPQSPRKTSRSRKAPQILLQPPSGQQGEIQSNP